mgnify:CR=1 FL=1
MQPTHGLVARGLLLALLAAVASSQSLGPPVYVSNVSALYAALRNPAVDNILMMAPMKVSRAEWPETVVISRRVELKSPYRLVQAGVRRCFTGQSAPCTRALFGSARVALRVPCAAPAPGGRPRGLAVCILFSSLLGLLRYRGLRGPRTGFGTAETGVGRSLRAHSANPQLEASKAPALGSQRSSRVSTLEPFCCRASGAPEGLPRAAAATPFVRVWGICAGRTQRSGR